MPWTRVAERRRRHAGPWTRVTLVKEAWVPWTRVADPTSGGGEGGTPLCSDASGRGHGATGATARGIGQGEATSPV